MIVESFLAYSQTKLRQYLERIEVCLGKLDEEQIWSRGGGNENSIGNLCLHLEGNVRQWILSGLGGLQDERQRDAEFGAAGGISGQELAAGLRATVERAAETIGALTPAQLEERTEVQGYPVSGLEIVYHVVEHFSHHAGQILYATKALSGEDLGFHRHLTRTQQHGEKTP